MSQKLKVRLVLITIITLTALTAVLAVVRPTGLNAVQVLAVAKGQESGQSELRQLMTERRAILNRIVGKMEVHLEAGRIGIDEFMDANIALVRAELDLCQTRPERLKVLQKMVQFLTTCEGMVAKRAAAGRATEVDVDKAKAARLQAQIELARERMTK